ncbi:MAG: hypothetical protein IK104_03420 [Clostridia bacterium]|nr:hypothetical protein [Clostridia bacterium]
MEAFVTKLLTMSLGGACVIAATLLIRLPLRKAPHKWAVLLWTLAALRLICPFTFSTDAALTPDVKTLLPEAAISEETPGTPADTANLPAAPGEERAGQPLPQTDAPQNPVPGQAGTLSPAQSGTQQTETPQAGTQSPAGPGGTGTPSAAEPTEKEIPAETKQAPSLPKILFAVWAAGAGAMLVYAAASYLSLLRKTRARLETGEGVYVCDALPGPFVLGAVKPKVFLPSDLPDDVSAAVLAHEKAHLRRRDPLVKLLGFLILTLHWFNPFVWAAYLLLGRDLELAADEEALALSDAEGRKRYASALIACALPKRGLSVAPLGFGEIGVKRRIRNMSVKKKLGVGLAILLVIAAGAVCVFLMTDKKPASPAEEPADGLVVTGETDSFPEGEIELTVTLENKSDRAVMFGSSAGDLPAHLEVKGGDGSWTPILTDLIWFADAEILQPHTSTQKTVSLQGHALSPGEYRLDVGWRDDGDGDAAFSHAYFAFTVTALEGGLRLTGDNDVIAYRNRVINVTATNGSGDRLMFGSMLEGQEPPALEKQTGPGVWETVDHHAFPDSIDITSLSIMSPGETRSFSVYAGDLLYSPGEYRLRLAYYKADEKPAESRPRYAYLPFTVAVPERTVLRENDPTVMLRADEPEDAGPAFAAAKDCLLKRVLQRFGVPDGDPLADSILAVRDDPALAGLAARAADVLQRDERPFYADPALENGGLQAFFDNLSVYEKGNAYFDRRFVGSGRTYTMVDVGYSLLESAEEDGVAVLVIYEALDYRETSRSSDSFMGSRYTVTLFSVGGVWRVAALESDYLLNRGGYRPENYDIDAPDGILAGTALSDAEFDALLDELFAPSDRFTNEEIARLSAKERALFSSVQRFFTSYYADPRDMDLGLFLRYLDECRNSGFSDPGSPDYSPETMEILKKEMRKDETSLEALPVHLYDLDELNAYLDRYLGITVEEMHRDWLHPTDEYYSVVSALFPEETEIRMPGFLPSLNAFYTRTSDWVGGTFSPVGATRDGDRICLYGETAYAMLRQTETGLKIEAFLPLEIYGAYVNE